MAHVVAGQHVIQDLCKAFNIDPTKLRKIVITAQYNDVVWVEVTRLVTEDYRIDEITNKYVLSEWPKEQKEVELIADTELSDDVKVGVTYLFPNNTVVTYDQNREQIPGLQGVYTKKLHQALIDHSTPQTQWNGFPILYNAPDYTSTITTNVKINDTDEAKG